MTCEERAREPDRLRAESLTTQLWEIIRKCGKIKLSAKTCWDFDEKFLAELTAVRREQIEKDAEIARVCSEERTVNGQSGQSEAAYIEEQILAQLTEEEK